MVLKLIKRINRENIETNTGSNEIVIEFYEGKRIVTKQDFIILDDEINIMLLKEYSKCEITGDKIEVSVVEAYIMNNDGKTIEKIR